MRRWDNPLPNTTPAPSTSRTLYRLTLRPPTGGPAFFQGVATQEPTIIESLLKAFRRTWAGTPPAEFEAQVREWMGTVKQPKLGVSYLDLVYLLINHDDADREFAYTTAAEASMAKAEQLGWTVVGMKSDWSTVYGKLIDL